MRLQLHSCYLTKWEQEELPSMHLRSCLLKLTLSSQSVELGYILFSCKGQCSNLVLASGWWENPTMNLEVDPKA